MMLLPRASLAGWVLVLMPALARADAFDGYTNAVLAKAVKAEGVQKVDRLAPDVLVKNSHVLPGVNGALVIVKTADNRWAKVLVQPARQKISATESVPILLIDRFVTYREGEEKRVDAVGQNIRLFAGFRFNLDIGQIVPSDLPADIQFTVDKEGSHVAPVGAAQMYLVTKHLPEAQPKGTPRPTLGAAFEARHFNGSYHLHDDGRRSGTLKLQVSDKGDVTGAFYSDKDGTKYDVEGKISVVPYRIEFKIYFPRTFSTFDGYMFTRDARAIAGTARLEERETGFYATRIEDEK